MNKTMTKVTGAVALALIIGFFAACTGPLSPESDSTAARTALAASNIQVSGTTAADVAPVVSGGGFITVVNNGAHVAATQTGLGKIDILNNGGVLTATNTGTGLMTIVSTATGAVAVTNTGTGNVTVNATGAAAIAITHTGDEDFFYPAR